MIYLFPGQGSQKIGMGQGLFEQFPNITAAADEVLGYSIAKLCMEDSANQLNLTLYTQPALYVVNALSYFACLEENTFPQPDYAIGHSLGEYNALLAAEAFDFETGLKLVLKRAQLMSRAQEGGMSAVIGLTVEQLQNVFQTLQIETVDIANLNSPTQIVISGPPTDLDRVDRECKVHGAKLVVRLNVSGAFHSRYMQPSAFEFSKFLSNIIFSPLNIAVVANSTAQPYVNGEIALRLAEQIASPVRWTDSIAYLLHTPNPEFKELGPHGVLTKLVKQIATSLGSEAIVCQ
jgi:malonyl CoA-acyl carrier protein transacylase